MQVWKCFKSLEGSKISVVQILFVGLINILVFSDDVHDRSIGKNPLFKIATNKNGWSNF